MARKRPTASNDEPLLSRVDAVSPIRLVSDAPVLTRAEARALARSAPLSTPPLTQQQFKTHGRLAERGISPLGRR